jgi:4-hydroxy 2-oxovalerate aldolase
LITNRRKSVKILDCTIRDGGLCNNWDFSFDLVRETVRGLSQAGVDMVEIGYRNLQNESESTGPWRFCAETDLREVVDGKIKVSVMVDQGRFDIDTFVQKNHSVIDVVRIATYAKDVQKAVQSASKLEKLGYHVYCNVMAVSCCSPSEADLFLGELRDSAVSGVYVVDSFGALYPHHVRYLVRKFRNWLRGDQEIGIHFHNNQQSAFANTIAAIDEGVDLVDATLCGVGRGAGNCPIELLLMYLDLEEHNIEPVLRLTEKYSELANQLHCNYNVPYAISGALNIHPSTAIELVSNKNQSFIDYYRAHSASSESTTSKHPGTRLQKPRE